ncbi:MAG: ABC-F family ATP-binding cassette domain-containing protein, partial [Actinobacteria bacterium]|nr:ABC-F family ATP-binding cassette domain-containing protein [Actinomycetota bacterium]
SKFTALRKERRQQQLAAYKNQQKEIADINRFIERFRYKNTKAVQVQSRIKYLDKLERIEIDAMDTSSINIRFPASPRSGNVVIEAENISKNYGDKKVLDDINMYIRRGERIAFVGKNGEGKTTLSRILVGDLDFKGSLKTGHNVKTGYFAQNQDELLDGELTVLDDLYRAASGQTMPELRSILGAFLFGEDDIDKKIKFLSGGERSRLALIKLLLAPYNFLILDEPTNHLDMRSKDILKQALLNFAGTIVLVSHDREFLEGLAETVYEFKSQKIKKYTGGIADFLESRKINSLKILEIKQKNQADAMALQEFSSGKDSYIDKKEFEKNLRKLTKDITKCEDKIEVLEKEIAGLSTKFESNSIDYSDSQNRQLFENYAKLKDELDKNVNHWEELHRQLAESRDYDKGPLF